MQQSNGTPAMESLLALGQPGAGLLQEAAGAGPKAAKGFNAERHHRMKPGNWKGRVPGQLGILGDAASWPIEHCGLCPVLSSLCVRHRHVDVTSGSSSYECNVQASSPAILATPSMGPQPYEALVAPDSLEISQSSHDPGMECSVTPRVENC